MKKSKVGGVFIFVICLMVYLMFVKHHYSTRRPDTHRPPPHVQHGPHRNEEDNGDSFQYGVMFDAGSTGTRVHIFSFQMDQGAPKLDHETFRAIKPGLSSYADDPQKCSAGIMELLNVAKSSVPLSMWTRTPVVLKATAGLRLLPGQKADQLLDTVRVLFQESPFLSREDSVSIMDGTDEGISAWITINVLTGGLHRADMPTVGMLDLGGGSTQITFSPRDEKTVQTSLVDFIRSVQMFNTTHTVYTHSYLGLGLMSARLGVLGGVQGPLAPPGGSTELLSSCLPPDSSSRWEYADVVYTVKGQKAGELAYKACLTEVQKFLYSKVMKASEAADVHFYAFSFYYDRAVDLGLIDEKKGGTVRVSDYVHAAKRVCGGLSIGPLQSPFLCLDLVYISLLLQGLGLPPHQQLRLVRTINQVETSWALGATFHYMESLKRH
ncbi:ectonucleoside triphosphate diphosphohydrolase 6 [Nematolebias whitei]|uniref:ectonucleoside triphosphate diphosphohydrolase 6 n=1 Tax=Nematolebias whitei TaxID=451745 RepID=UPI001897653F|nr:ectonucleoside triphosphate diphosphohydrolase 6 [Nematolebias whitei]